MRDLDVDLLDALDQDHILHMAALAEFDFVEGMQRLWAGPEGHALSLDGFVYNSLADLGQIDKLAESQGLADSRTTVSLRVNSDVIDVIGGADSRGRDAKLILLFLTDQGKGIGRMDFFKTMGALRVQASATGRDAEHGKLITERITLELLDETANLGNSYTTRMTYDQGLRIDGADHGLEFISDPEMSQLKGLRDRRGPGDGGGGRPGRHPRRQRR